MINGDKIRQMSNEELAEVMCCKCVCCKYVLGDEACSSSENACEYGIKAYLDMEVE